MSDWTDLRDKFVSGVASQDVRVYVKTNLGKEVLIYDSGNPSVAEKGGESFIKYGIKVKNQNDVELFNYGSYPRTNYFIIAGLVGSASLGLFIILKGLKSSIT